MLFKDSCHGFFLLLIFWNDSRPSNPLEIDEIHVSQLVYRRIKKTLTFFNPILAIFLFDNRNRQFQAHNKQRIILIDRSLIGD